MDMTYDEKVEKIKKLVGTEFTYTFNEEASLPAIVAAFDPKVGFTCLALSLISSDGTDHESRVDANGNFCLVGVSIEGYANEERMVEMLYNRYYTSIIMGEYCTDFRGGGSASCAF